MYRKKPIDEDEFRSYELKSDDDSLAWDGVWQKVASQVVIDPHDDHRIAMCFSLVSLLGVPVVINNPECVNKTFPTYFEVFQGIMKK